MIAKTTARFPAVSTPRTLVLPFVNTPPLVDALIMIVLVPVWWALGFDQLIWLAAGPYIALRLVIGQGGRVRVPPALRLLALFIGCQIVSALFIVETERYITFIRTTGAYVAAFCFALVIVNTVTTPRHVRLVVGVVLCAMIMAAIFGLLAIVGVWRPFYSAPTTFIFPDSLENTSYGANLVARRLGEPAWFSWFGNYFRVTSFFLHPTLYAIALLMIVPLAIRAFWSARTLPGRAVWLVTLGVLAVNLLFTTGRLAWIGLAVGAVYYVLLFSPWRTLGRIFAIGGCILAIGVVAAAAWEDGGIPAGIVDPVDDLLFARGGGSVVNRSDVYVQTLTNWTQRPLLGWGSERDLITLRQYPAGSHSYYLGVLYRFGIVGAGVFIAMGIAVWRGTRPPNRRSPVPADDQRRDIRAMAGLLSYGRWIMVGLLVNAITEVIDLDTMLLVLMWVIIAVLLCARTLVEAAFDAAPTPFNSTTQGT